MSWPISALGDHVDILSGFAFKSQRFNNEGRGLPLVRIRDVVPGQSDTFYEGPFEERYIVSDGDLLVGMDGEFNRARWRGGRSLLNQRVCKISPTKHTLDESYLFHALPQILKKIEDRTPFATVKHLSAKDLRQVEFPLPPLDEQKRIAAILDQADELRRLRQRAIDRLNELGQAIFYEMVGDPATNTMGWNVAALGELIREDDKINYGVVQPGDAVVDGVPLIRVADIVRPVLDVKKLKRIEPKIEGNYKRSRLKGDEILVGCVGSIGAVALANQKLKGANIARAVGRIPLDPAKADRLFVAEMLRTKRVQGYFSSETRTVAQPTLNIKQLSETPVCVPPLEYQKHFSHRVVVVEEQKILLANQLADLDRLFSSLQHRAFRGEL